MEKQTPSRYPLAMLKRPVAPKSVFIALLAGALIATSAAKAQTNAISMPLRARQLIGMKVEDLNGQKAGTIHNLVLDLNKGGVRYAVIGSGGYLGLRATLKLAPSEAVTAATAKRQTLEVLATTPQWRQAPVFKYSSLATLAEPERASQISRYFRTSTGSAKNNDGNSLSTTGREAGQTQSPRPLLKFANDLIGMRVVDPKQEKMGEVIDLLVSFGEPRPAFAIISTGKLFHHAQHYAVPLNALGHSDDKLVLNVDTAALQAAPVFDEAAWKSGGKGGQNRVYRYSTTE
jgi:sporulation protein YlmC with PRC-barrel domain